MSCNIKSHFKILITHIYVESQNIITIQIQTKITSWEINIHFFCIFHMIMLKEVITFVIDPRVIFFLKDWLIYCVSCHFQQYFSYIMAISFSGGRSRSTRREPPIMGKQLVNFITCGCDSSAVFFIIYKAGREPMLYWW